MLLSPVRWRTVLILSATWLLGISLPAALSAAEPLVTQAEFQKALDQFTSAAWDRTPVRHACARIAELWKLSLVIDRRIDPSRELTVDLADQSVEQVFRALAAHARGELSLPENTLFIGPPEAASRLRTLIALRTAELEETARSLPPARRRVLSRAETVAWEDLATPREILTQLAADYDLQLKNIDEIPHDLWAGSELPQTSLPAALSIVLIQFDLTFTWLDAGESVQFVPIPERVRLEQTHQPRKMTAEAAARQWEKEFAGISTRIVGPRVAVTGTVEQQEAIARLLTNPGTPGERPKPAGPVPLKERTFTLPKLDAPASALMKKLEDSGIEFKYDPAELEKQGIKLDQRIQLQVNQATADEFFKAVFDPLGLAFEIDGVTVTLRPK